MAGQRMKLQRAMGLVAVQEDRDRRNGDVGQRQRGEHRAPPRQVEKSGEEQSLHECLLPFE
jgi:hypothetical protein